MTLPVNELRARHIREIELGNLVVHEFRGQRHYGIRVDFGENSPGVLLINFEVEGEQRINLAVQPTTTAPITLDFGHHAQLRFAPGKSRVSYGSCPAIGHLAITASHVALSAGYGQPPAFENRYWDIQSSKPVASPSPQTSIFIDDWELGLNDPMGNFIPLTRFSTPR